MLTQKQIDKLLRINKYVVGSYYDGKYHFSMENCTRDNCGNLKDFYMQTANSNVYSWCVYLSTHASYDLGEIVGQKIELYVELDDAIAAISKFLKCGY